MKDSFKKISILLTILIGLIALVGCNGSSVETEETNIYKDIKEAIVTPSNGVFSDLGDYLILMDEYTEADYDRALAHADKSMEGLGDSCTACGKRNSEGEVLIGRNLDNEISLCPAFIIPTSFGKYKTISIRYMNSDVYTYEEFLKDGYKDEDFINYIPFAVTDAFNTEGLYIEANVREPYKEFINTGTNPGKKRAYTTMVTALVAQNCATVKEAVEYVRNELDIYSTPYIDDLAPTQYGFFLGDATGEYGIIEIVGNEITYLPYQNGQGNYYLTPKWNAIEKNGAGYGRLARALEGLEDVNTDDEMLQHMQTSMWRDYVLYAENSYIDENGKAVFVDDDGNPTIDWRSDLTNQIPIDVYGNVTDEYTQENLARCDAKWMMDDKNAKIVFDRFKDLFVKNGWKEKLLEYYKGNELPLREVGSLFTTGVQYSVNCAKKTMIIKFFEKDNLVFKININDFFK